MKSAWKFTVLLIIGGVSSLTTTSFAQATLPEDITVEYLIREAPTNTSSAVIYKFRLTMTAVAEDAGQVAWEVARLDIVRQDEGPAPETLWSELSPTILTGDGYWWVTHADVENIKTLDFAQPPLITGTAEAAILGTPGMVYFLEAGICDVVCGNLFDGNVTALNYALQLEEAEDPEASGGNEPVEVPTGGGGVGDHGI